MRRSRETAGPRADLRLVPVAVAAWLGSWCAVSGSRPAVVTAAVCALGCLGFAAATRSARWTAVACVVLATLGVGQVHRLRLADGPVHDLATERAAVSGTVVTLDDPRLAAARAVRPAYLTLRARVLTITGRGAAWRTRAPVLVTVSGTSTDQWRGLATGSTLALDGRLEPATRGSDVAAVLRVRGPATVVRGPGPGMRLVDRVRAGLRDAVSGRAPDVRALVPALVLGDTSAMPADLTEAFKVTGLSHVSAVSGANLAIMLGFLLTAGRWAGLRGWWLRGLALAGVVVFVALCRSEPSVLRAAAMGLVTLAALGAGGARAGPRNLSVAVLVLLLLDPFLSRTYGFALSVLASAGIIWWGRRWSLALGSWLPGPLAEAVGVPLAAQVATLPVIAQLAGSISVAGLFANALAGPFVGPATVLGFAAAALSLLSPATAALAGFGAAWSAQPIVWVARLGAGLPGASVGWPATPTSITLISLAAVVGGMSMSRLLARRWLSLLSTAALITGLVVVPAQPGWPPRGWVFVACSVGQGDGLVVRVGSGQAVVVDTGPDPPAIRRCLDQLGIGSVPLLVLTHFHADHVDGLTGVLEHRTVREIWVSPLASPAVEATRVRRLAAARGIAVSTPVPGSAGRLGEVSWQVLGPLRGPGAAAEETSEAENDASLVLMITVSGIRLLLTGDVEPPGQQAIAASGADLRADVLKVPHHGSAQQDGGFLAATHARFAVASMGLDNDYGHPAPRTVAVLTGLGMTFLRTDTEGSIAILGEPGHLSAVTQRR